MDLTLLVFGFIVLGIVGGIAGFIWLLYRKGSSSENVIFVEDQGQRFRLGKLKKCGNMFHDTLTNKAYTKVTKTVSWNGKRLPLLDADKGVSLHPEIDNSVLKLKTNPDFIGRIIDPVILQNAFKIKPEIKQILIAFVIGVIVGIIFFAPVI